MDLKKCAACAIAGGAAGAVTGLFGAGGGMVLVPLLCSLTDLEEDAVFPTSICIILPICLVSLGITCFRRGIAWGQAFPYLIGSTIGGLLAARWGNKVPVTWLHRLLGILILWGGIRYIW